MALEIFRLVGSIMVDSKDAENSLAKTDEKAEKVGSHFGDGVKKAGKWALGVGAAAGAVGAALFKTAESSAAASDEIDKMSKRLGLSREAYQELDFALSQSGVDITSFSTGAKTLLKNMDAVTEGNKTAIANFDKLGVAVQNSDGSLRSQEDVLFDTISALQQMEDSTEKSRLAQELFGKQGQEILPLLDNESESIDALRQQAHDLNLVLSDETIDAGVEFTDTMDQSKRSLQTVMTTVGAELMPVIQAMLTWVLAHMPEIKATVSSVVSAIRTVIQALMPIIESAFKVAEKLWNSSLKPILNGIISFLTGAFTGNWRQAWNGVKQIFSGFANGLKEIFRSPLNWIIDKINAFLRGLNGIKIPDWVPGVGGKSFSINLIPRLARGGILERGQIGLLEGNGAEAVVPLENNAKWIRAVARDMNQATGGNDERTEELLEQILAALLALLGKLEPTDLDRLVALLAPGMNTALGRAVRRKLV